MVEGQFAGQGIERKNAAMFGVIGRLRQAFRFGQINRGDGMVARVPGRVRINAQQNLQPDVQANFFFRFAHRRLFHGFTDVDEASGNGPAQRRVGAFDQYERPVRQVDQLDQYVGSK